MKVTKSRAADATLCLIFIARSLPSVKNDEILSIEIVLESPATSSRELGTSLERTYFVP